MKPQFNRASAARLSAGSPHSTGQRRPMSRHLLTLALLGALAGPAFAADPPCSDAVPPEDTNQGIEDTTRGENATCAPNATAYGFKNVAHAQGAAVGVQNAATGESAAAFGNNNTASGVLSIAIGAENDASNTQAIAVGSRNRAAGIASAAMGQGNIATGNRSSALGVGSEASGLRSAAIGHSNEAIGQDSAAMGNNNEAVGFFSSAIGVLNKADARSSVAMGLLNEVTGFQAVAVGSYNRASGESSSVFGVTSHASADGSTAVGFEAVAAEEGVVSFGHVAGDEDGRGGVYATARTARLVNISEGVNDTDAVNKGQMEAGDASTLSAAQSHADTRATQTLVAANAYADAKFAGWNDGFAQFQQSVEYRFAQTDRRIDRSGAMQTAMAQMSASAAGIRTANRVAVGVGAQNGQTALSVGYQRAIGDKAAFTIGGAFSGDENSAGVGYGFGW